MTPNLVIMGVEVEPRLGMDADKNLILWLQPVYEAMPDLGILLGPEVTSRVIEGWVRHTQDHRASVAPPVQPVTFATWAVQHADDEATCERAAADRIEALEAALRKVDMVYLNPVNDPITIEKRKLLSRLIREALEESS